MACSSSSDDEAITGINVTSIDKVTLNLLIIFMVIAKLITGQGTHLDLPKAATDGATQTTLTIDIDHDGEVLANGQAVAGDAALANQARQALKKNPELRTVVSASARASHGSVMHVVDTVREAGIVKIAFAADKAESRTTVQ